MSGSLEDITEGVCAIPSDAGGVDSPRRLSSSNTQHFTYTGVANLTSQSIYIAGHSTTDFEAYFLLRRYSSHDDFLSEYDLALESKTCMATSERRDDATDMVIDVGDYTEWQDVKSKTRTFTEEDQGLYYLTFQRCVPEGDDNKVRRNYHDAILMRTSKNDVMHPQ